MLSRSIRQVAVKGARMASTTKRSSINGPGAFEGAYQIFMKNNVTYVGTILVAAVIVEAVYGGVTNSIWESSNRGRLYHHIDWSLFKTDDDEEEEEEDEEEAADDAEDAEEDDAEEKAADDAEEDDDE